MLASLALCMPSPSWLFAPFCDRGFCGPGQNERALLSDVPPHRNIVRLLHTFVSKPTDAMVGLLGPELQARLEPADLTGKRVRDKAQFFLMEYLPQTLEKAITEM